MLTVALWDLGQSKRPALNSIPKYLRRVGADLVALVDPPEGSSDTLGRHSGYRSRSLISGGTPDVAVYARRGLVTQAEPDQFGASRISLSTDQGALTLFVARLSRSNGAREAAQLIDSCRGPLVLAGDLGHDLANPQGSWALLKKDLIDHIEHAGASPLQERTHGFLSRGVQPRGGASLEKAAGGASALVWIRIAI